MNEFAFAVRLTRHDRVAADLASIAEPAEAALFADLEPLRVRVYPLDVRVEIDWSPLRSSSRTVHLHPRVVGAISEADAASYVELFFHDAFLILNLAVPGSLSVSTSAFTLHSRVFEYAWLTAARNDWPFIEPLSLRDVVRWYDAAGVAPIATTPESKALLHLLHLARSDENERATVLHLSHALEALAATLPPPVLSLRDAVASGTAPLVHPLSDDPAIDAITLDFTDAADLAASLVLGELQGRVKA